MQAILIRYDVFIILNYVDDVEESIKWQIMHRDDREKHIEYYIDIG